MSYSVHFFAVASKSLANQLLAEQKALLDRTEKRIRAENRFAEEDIQSTMAKAAAICQGNLPDDCDNEYFHALCWLTDVTSEKVKIGSFLGFRSLSFLEETGIWPWLLRSRPPLAVPICSAPPPQVGFLSVGDIEGFAIAAIDQLPSNDSADVCYAREEFREVLESLLEDQLDLLAVLM